MPLLLCLLLLPGFLTPNSHCAGTAGTAADAFLSGESNATEKYPDDRILDDQGSAVCWDSSKCTRKDSCDELSYFFGTTTNKYGRQLDAYIDKVFALGYRRHSRVS